MQLVPTGACRVRRWLPEGAGVTGFPGQNPAGPRSSLSARLCAAASSTATTVQCSYAHMHTHNTSMAWPAQVVDCNRAVHLYCCQVLWRLPMQHPSDAVIPSPGWPWTAALTVLVTLLTNTLSYTTVPTPASAVVLGWLAGLRRPARP